MKKLSLFLIGLYQKIPGVWHFNCRFYPTCSNYAKEAITEYGFIYGWYLSIKRILKCNPFSSSGYDPVPKNKQKKR